MISRLKTYLNRSVLVLSAVLVAGSFTTPGVSALNQAQIKSLINGTVFYNPDFSVTCSITGESVSGSETNVDYNGNQIFNATQLDVINKNKPFYETAANSVGIPWQMIAVIHMRETSGQRINPSNGQGIYQFVDQHGGPYAEGEVSDVEFARQTRLAAEFIKAKAASNYENNRNLTNGASVEVVKDTFFSYNGRATAYIEQAQKLGFSNNQGYEGSPYVMNLVDSKRNPDTAAPETWGQIKQDGGTIEYPANRGYGAFVMYAALSGISLNGACQGINSSDVAQRAIAIAKQELELWKNGTLKPNGADYHKYTGGASANWCAYFASWVYNQAGYPLSDAKNGVVPSVTGIMITGKSGNNFVWNSATDPAYTPKPGDLVIQKEGKSHVNIIIAVNGDKLTVIGGNQGYSAQDFNGDGQISSDERGAADFKSSRVTQYIINGKTGDGNTGFVSPR